MCSTHSYDRKSFLAEFFPDADDRAEVEVGAEHLVAVSRARLAHRGESQAFGQFVEDVEVGDCADGG